ncbi:MAG: GFA family protein, partial [Mesorhizobium sp.]
MTIKASCHCKATTFEVSQAPQTVTQCTCSF